MNGVLRSGRKGFHGVIGERLGEGAGSGKQAEAGDEQNQVRDADAEM